jgi:hypothetical protein
MTSDANTRTKKNSQHAERRGRKKAGGEGEGELLINRTSLFPVDTFIEPPNPSRLNAFTLQSSQKQGLKRPLGKLVSTLAKEVPRQKREHQETVLLTFQILLKNLEVCWQTNQWVSIQGQHSAFSKDSRYADMGLGRNINRHCLITLQEAGFILKAEHNYQGKQTALYYPAERLQAIFMDGLYMPYKGHQKCGIFVSGGKKDRPANLPSDHRDLVSIHLIHEHFKVQRLPNYSPLRFIFKDSAVDPYCLYGGRLYTNTQQIPMWKSPIRKFTTINFEKCCEVDLSANHLRISAALHGIELDGDPYLEIQNITKAKHRDDVKRVVASLLSTGESETHKAKHSLASPENKREEQISRKTFDAIHNAINQIFPWFKSARGIGTNLQSIEGQILLEAMLLLLNEGITSIPIHDSLRVPIQHNEKTAEILKETWSRNLGVDFETKVNFKNH